MALTRIDLCGLLLSSPWLARMREAFPEARIIALSSGGQIGKEEVLGGALQPGDEAAGALADSALDTGALADGRSGN